MKPKIIIETRQKKYINQTMCFIGVLLQNNLTNYVSLDVDITNHPFLRIQEGYILSPELYNLVRRSNNILIYKKHTKVLEKRLTDSDPIIVDNAYWIWDLYDSEDLEQIKNLIRTWESDNKIYIVNTETIPKIEPAKTVAGVASGSGLASIAEQSHAKNIIFFDYNKKALDFQKDLIDSSNRKEVFYKYRENMTLGRPINVGEREIEKIDFIELDRKYNYLKKCDVNFVHVDLRNKSDIEELFDCLDKNAVLWLSNVLHYSTNFLSFTQDFYDIIDNLAETHLIKILPYTRVCYES